MPQRPPDVNDSVQPNAVVPPISALGALQPLTCRTRSAAICLIRSSPALEASEAAIRTHLQHSPDTASAENLRNFQLHLIGSGVSPITLNATISPWAQWRCVLPNHTTR